MEFGAQPALISSRQHELVKTFRKVARGDRRFALLDGWHLIEDAERAGLALADVAIGGEPPDAAARDLLDRLRPTDARLHRVSAEVLAAMSPVRTPSGIVALASRREHAIGALLEPAPSLVVIVEGVQDPGNAGALIRSAEAGGATGVLLGGSSVDPWSWKALRAAMGSTFRLPVVRDPDAAGGCRVLRERGLQVLGAVPRGGTPAHERQLTGPIAFVLGGEGPGLSDLVRAELDGTITIPMLPSVESLNLAVAAALLVYEARRQRDAI